MAETRVRVIGIEVLAQPDQLPVSGFWRVTTESARHHDAKWNCLAGTSGLQRLSPHQYWYTAGDGKSGFGAERDHPRKTHRATGDSMRKARLHRSTTETDIQLSLAIEGRGKYQVSTGIRFFDHMLELFARHGAFDLKLKALGD